MIRSARNSKAATDLLPVLVFCGPIRSLAFRIGLTYKGVPRRMNSRCMENKRGTDMASLGVCENPDCELS